MTTLTEPCQLTLVRKKLEQPLSLLALWASSTHHQKAYWAVPDAGFEFVALGKARHFRTDERASRFETVRADLGTLNIDVIGEAGPDFTAGVLVGGFAFSDREIERHPDWAAFGGGELVLPEIFVTRSNDQTWITHVEGAEIPVLSPSLDLDLGWVKEVDYKNDDDYLALVSNALKEIESGNMTKVVTARSLSLPANLNCAALLERLKERHPSCATFAIGHGSQVFLGASPEKLVNVEGNHLETAALAGSRPRHDHPGADAQLRAELLANPKERNEHQIVIDDITESLATAGVHLDSPVATGVMKLRRIQHLHTPISGTLPNNTDILDIVKALHPTPAVAGLPRQRSQDWIDQHESMDRGWYAAPVGWMTPNGSGEFRVALRSALLTDTSLTLFAGGGIVEGAEPIRELAETANKFEALLGALDLTP
ncbi:MAG TPA: hypothetical protein DCX77_07850 [Acidimicrobiaceae bacterium]|nr:hypothetical protein [Acidimicrobiaceae bacterium]HAX05575.1 hypothetical protein [Acidimicrobiaceae bacterium]|tara:strand:+ start:56 stop:1336 length:1281 start_codon:yes stop_codon:yes gene_type:complete